MLIKFAMDFTGRKLLRLQVEEINKNLVEINHINTPRYIDDE